MARLLPLLAATLLWISSSPVWSAPAHPFPSHAETLWATPATLPDHKTRAQLDQDARTLYDAWKARYVAQAGSEADGHPRYRIRVGRNADDPTVSEGQGSGMRIVALFAGHDPDARRLFDGLVEFARDHRSILDPRLMDWFVAADEGPDPSGDDSAFDGDADIALGLLLAEAQWGNGGRIDYGAEAASVITGLRQSALGSASFLPLLGDWVNVASGPYDQWTPRSSDLQPASFRSFGYASGDATWGEAVVAAHSLVEQMQGDFAAGTGLLPDFMQPQSPASLPLRPADPNFLEAASDGSYGYNATRVPLRLGIDALLFAEHASTTQVRRISLWIASSTGGEPAQIRAGYMLDGTPLPGSNYFTTAFAAPFGVAALASGSQESWLEAIYESVHDSDEGYYEDTISLLCMLVMTGNYWHPQLLATPAPVPSSSAVGHGAIVISFALLGPLLCRRGQPAAAHPTQARRNV